jgi:hypothetical protein
VALCISAPKSLKAYPAPNWSSPARKSPENIGQKIVNATSTKTTQATNAG